jgi:predicted NBD/HSP70 family sugar kinase
LGIGLAAYVDIFNPEVIIIGGGLPHARALPGSRGGRDAAPRSTESLKVVRWWSGSRATTRDYGRRRAATRGRRPLASRRRAPRSSRDST